MMKPEKKENSINIMEILQTYKVNEDIMNEEDELIQRLKYLIWNLLDETERRILLLYASLGSMRKTGAVLGCSASTVYIWVKKIREKLINEI